MDDAILEKSVKDILEGYERFEAENKELKKEIQFWKNRCKKLEQNLRIFSGPNVGVEDFIND